MRRYAIYAVPGAQADDPPVAHQVRTLAATWYAKEEFHELTVNPRRYGFHGTLKAPFRLAADHTEAQLQTAVSEFAAHHQPVMLRSLTRSKIGRFFALTPHGETSELNALAADVVETFDTYRAPLSEEDVQRRNPEAMTPTQRELFYRWGYPYVMEEFRFHLTLTDAVPEGARAGAGARVGAGAGADADVSAGFSSGVGAAVEQHFASVSGCDVPVTSLCIFVEPRPGADFEVLSVHPFSPTSFAPLTPLAS